VRSIGTQVSIRTGMIAVIVLAVWLGLVRAILESSDKPVNMAMPAGLFTVFYFWAVLLFLVVRAEKWTDALVVSPDVWAWQCYRRFIIWLQCGAIAPLLMLALALVFHNQWRTGGLSMPGLTMACLFWVPLFHWLAGVLICREMRWPAFLVGVPLMMVSFGLGIVGLAAVGVIGLD
jgi:hypothetical protein